MLRLFYSIIFLFLLAIFAKPAFAAENILLFDDFSDGNFNGWTVQSGNWIVNSGNLLVTTTGIFNFLGEIHTGSSEWDNYKIEFDLNQVSGVDNGIEFRKSGNTSYVFNLRHGTGIHNTPEIKFFKVINGVGTLVTSTHNQQLLNSVWYNIKIEVKDENIKLWINGNQIFDFTDSGTSIKKGGIGFQSWTGAVGSVQIRFDNVKVTSLITKTPLILIPGIGGSEFKVAEDTLWSQPDGHGGTFEHEYTKDEKVWVNEGEAIKPGNDDYFDILRMKVDGITSEANLELTGEVFAGAYQETIDFFTENGYELNKDLFVFPYDWRKDISLTAPLLDQKISEIKNETGSEKVDIIAHSMGGLVARNYITDLARAQNVRKLFTLGTPHLGSPDYIKNLMYGGCLRFEVGPFCLTLAPSELKDTIQNMIGGFELSPSLSYFNFYTGEGNNYPLPYRDDVDIDNNGIKGDLDYNQIKELLTNLGHNTSLFTPSEILHTLDSSLSNTNGVDVYIISGSGTPTLGQIIEKYAFNLGNIKIPKKDEIMINGDETVPLLSASLEDLDRNIFMNGSAKNYYTKQKHGALVTDGPTLNLVKNILEESKELPEGISDKAYKLNGKQLSVHSPVNIHVYDQDGNHTGPTPDGNFETNIPRSNYDSLDDAKFIWLPDEGVYNIVFEVTGEGSFDFKIRNFEDDINSQTILYEDIPINETSSGQTTFNTSGQSPILEIDGNNYTYFSILEGNANYDHTSPKVSFNVNPKIIWPPNGKLVDIKITGNIIDENPYLTTIMVDDEYDVVEPTIEIYNQTEYNQTIQLQASRRGNDLNGRTYTITIITKDLAGNETLQQLEIIVPHDKR